jgi:patatin-like phospholipase/acyl hydrolase
MKPAKVLIIVGGGIYGCIPARFLSHVEVPAGYNPLDGVDCISGCSIGGILALAYAAGWDFSELDEVFRARAKDCFCKRSAAYINPLTNPTYDGEALDNVLHDILGDGTMEQIRDVYPKLDVIVPALNITDDKYKVFNNIDSDDLSVPIKDVAAMTSAAPSYFPGRLHEGKCFIDGGLIEVAPLLTTVTALRSKRDIPFENMDVLMLGTGKDIDENPLTFERYEGLSLLGLATDVIVPYVTFANELATEYWGKHMGFRSFTYYNPCTHNGDLADVGAVPGCVDQCDKKAADFKKVWNDWLNG